jgi:hypothetical protein
MSFVSKSFLVYSTLFSCFFLSLCLIFSFSVPPSLFLIPHSHHIGSTYAQILGFENTPSVPSKGQKMQNQNQNGQKNFSKTSKGQNGDDTDDSDSVRDDVDEAIREANALVVGKKVCICLFSSFLFGMLLFFFF